VNVARVSTRDRDHLRRAKAGKCIAQWVKDPKVLLCAERAAWLGNDETHYTRRGEVRDITHLKGCSD
jgi:hypothetical protein